MSIFSLHAVETAPAQSKPLLEGAKAKIGFVPNLLGVLAEAPAALEAYLSMNDVFARTSLSREEQQVVLLTVAVVNECEYCVAAHSTIAAAQGVADADIHSIREDTVLADTRFEALRRFTTLAVENRGWVAEADVQAFIDAGFTRQNVLEVITGISLKILSNYVNHLVDTPVDDAFAPQIWTAAKAS
jgi:uncharacterized peroxidase-related enzyme